MICVLCLRSRRTISDLLLVITLSPNMDRAYLPLPRRHQKCILSSLCTLNRIVIILMPWLEFTLARALYDVSHTPFELTASTYNEP